MEHIVKKLQNDVAGFLTSTSLRMNGITIIPKEVEVYYYKEGVFADNSVHRNELQRNNPNHFYIHRWGHSRLDSYKGGNYPGIDFVLSDNAEEYYSYLIRSAVINNETIVGPHKVLEAIESMSNLKKEEIEQSSVEMLSHESDKVFFFSKRINLGKEVLKEYRDCELRAVVCDDYFHSCKYPAKEMMVVEFVKRNVEHREMTNKQASVFAKEILGYVPSEIRKI